MPTNTVIFDFSMIDSVVSALDPAVLEKVLQDTLNRVAADIEREAKMTCPVNTGQLRSSIHMELSSTAEIGAGVVVRSPYAVYVEFGTGRPGAASVDKDGLKVLADHGGGLGSYTTKEKWVYPVGDKFYTSRGMPARPFLYPAFFKYTKQDHIKKRFREAYKKNVKGVK